MCSLLEPPTYQHEENDAAHGVEVPGASMGEDFIKASGECDEDSQGDGSVYVEKTLPQTFPGLDEKGCRTIKDYRDSEQNTDEAEGGMQQGFVDAVFSEVIREAQHHDVAEAEAGHTNSEDG